ncbi:YqcC family protein [Litoribacillus peritrichatus]|uniref:YqcC family protein n=1 Tax=Litoribacillus peritrichatus TaxID=718191 RepID=A0ABP7M5A7_9GAMM
MYHDRQAVQEVLRAIEQEMKRLEVWSANPPSPEALLSRQPFCYDTMALTEWVQFVFLVKMEVLMALGKPLPLQCGIAPMAEEYFKGYTLDVDTLIHLFRHLDELLGGLAEN